MAVKEKKRKKYAGKVDKDQVVKCLSLYGKDGERRRCMWEGTISECVEEYYESPEYEWAAFAGREGYRYHCPECGCIVKYDWAKER